MHSQIPGTVRPRRLHRAPPPYPSAYTADSHRPVTHRSDRLFSADRHLKKSLPPSGNPASDSKIPRPEAAASFRSRKVRPSPALRLPCISRQTSWKPPQSRFHEQKEAVLRLSSAPRVQPYLPPSNPRSALHIHMSRRTFPLPSHTSPHPHRHSGSSPPAPALSGNGGVLPPDFLRKHPAPLPTINVWQAALSARPRPPRPAAPAVPGQIGTSPTGFPADLPVRTDRKASYFPAAPGAGHCRTYQTEQSAPD